MSADVDPKACWRARSVYGRVGDIGNDNADRGQQRGEYNAELQLLCYERFEYPVEYEVQGDSGGYLGADQ